MCLPLAPDGRMLRAHRLNRGWTQAELAQVSGLSAHYISALERGKRSGGARGWKQLADALGVEVMDFMLDIEKSA